MINSWLIFWWLTNWYINKLLVRYSKPFKHLSNNKVMTLACLSYVLLQGWDSKQKTVKLYFPRAERIYWIPKFPQDLSSSAVYLKPKLVPVNHLLGRGLPSSQERCQLSATSTAGTGSSAPRPELGWVPISPMSNPHYCLSISCRHVKRTPRGSHSLKCFSHFCSTSFHLSSLTPCQNLISEDWRSLWIPDSVCHWIASRPFTGTTSEME